MIEETTNLEPVALAPKKKRINSKKKGSGFEGHIGKVLGEHLPPMKFRRSQSSGAILGGVNERFMEHYSDDAKALFIGDVVPTNEADVVRDHGWKLKFTLECKFYKTPDNIEHLLYNTKIRRWFEQACTDAAKIGKDPCLIFKFNHTEVFAAVMSNTAMPSTLTRSLVLSYKAEADLPERSFTVFHFKEALLDLPWWKKFTTTTTPIGTAP